MSAIGRGLSTEGREAMPSVFISFEVMVSVDLEGSGGSSLRLAAIGTVSSRASVSDDPSDFLVVSTKWWLDKTQTYIITVFPLDFTTDFVIVGK